MRMYYICTLVIFGFFFQVIAGNDESKYIDRLPEGEKQEVPQKIAKRIFKDVESTEDPNKVSDETLTNVKFGNESEDTAGKDIQVRNIHRVNTEEDNNSGLETETDKINNIQQVTVSNKSDPEIVEDHAKNLNITYKEGDSIVTSNTSAEQVTDYDLIEVTTIINTDYTKTVEHVRDTANVQKIRSDGLETILRDYGTDEIIKESEQEDKNNTNLGDTNSTNDYTDSVSLSDSVTESLDDLTSNISRKNTKGDLIMNSTNLEQNDKVKNHKDMAKNISESSETVTESSNKRKLSQLVLTNDQEAKQDIQVDSNPVNDFVSNKGTKDNAKDINDTYNYNQNNFDKINNGSTYSSIDEEKFNLSSATDKFIKHDNKYKTTTISISINTDNIRRSNGFTAIPNFRISNYKKTMKKNKLQKDRKRNKDYFKIVLINNYDNAEQWQGSGKKQNPYQTPKKWSFPPKRINKSHNRGNRNKKIPYTILIHNYFANKAQNNPKNPDFGKDEGRNDVHYIKYRKNYLSDNSDINFDKVGVRSLNNKIQHKEGISRIENLLNLLKTGSILKNIDENKHQVKMYKNVNNIYPESSEAEHPLTGYNEGDDSIKSIIRIIRKNLHKQQNFDYMPPVHSTESKASFKEIEDLVKTSKTQQIRTVKEEPIAVKRQKNPAFVRSAKGKKKLYLPRDINRQKADIFKYPEIWSVRSAHNDIGKTGNLQNMLRNILEYKQHNALDMIDKTRNDIDKGVESKFNDIIAHVEELEDLIKVNDESLTKYDWLGSTIDIQAAMDKLLGLTESVQNGENVDALDLELFKYVLHLFESSENKSRFTKLSLMRSFLPRNWNRKRKHHMLIKAKGLLERNWLPKRTLEKTEVSYNKLKSEELLNEFKDFLNRLGDSLYNLHTIIKYIAINTNYKKQRCYEYLKGLYLKGRKEYLEVILHLSASRLFDLIEENAQNRLEDGYKKTIRNNKEVYQSTKREFEFVLRLLDEIKFG